MDPVDLNGLDMESTVEGGEGQTFKVGEGLEGGEVSDEYVDPDRMDDIKTGGGDGEGRGGSNTPAGESGRNCNDREAEFVNRVRVDPDDYPMRARRRGVEGEIVALLTISRTGDVTNVELVQPLGHGLDKLAKQAFEKWKFEPARESCQAVETTVRATHSFRLKN
jgi:protein TonB